MHTNTERALVDTYTCNEIAFAVSECGYQLLDVYELIAYTKFEKIFTNFMTFLASQKIRYSGPPTDSLNTEKDLRTFCDNINDKMGFNHQYTKITPANLKTNTVRRNLVKEALNSLLGKMSQDSHVSSNLILSCEDELNRIITNPMYDIDYIQSVGERLVHVQVKRKAGFERINRKASLCVGKYCENFFLLN